MFSEVYGMILLIIIKQGGLTVNSITISRKLIYSYSLWNLLSSSRDVIS
ncbi:unnamed protein product [Brugia timori]|uniref:Uncharacterized protein n=1 Tax=Brugia timori TaxID=42155 RepID=A0A0R3R847_9BILA|nr:unnamed protein product [Brugia timori]